MATLKNLVDETTNIKNELVVCHTNLKNNLLLKGVEVANQDKISTLINKVNNVETGNAYLPHWATGGVWVRNPIMGITCGHANSVVVGKKLYVIGGSIGNGAIGYVRTYDAELNTTTPISSFAPVPTPREGMAASVVDEFIYTLGGRPGGTTSNINERYNTLTNTWDKKAGLPTARRYSTSQTVNKNIYIIAGEGAERSNDCYNTVTDTWSSKASKPTGANMPMSAMVGDIIYVFHQEIECYNTVTDTWNSKASKPPNYLYQTVVVTIYDRIYSTNNQADYSAMNCYNPISDTWSKVDNLIYGKVAASYGVIDNVLYVIGGHTYNSNYNADIQYYICRK